MHGQLPAGGGEGLPRGLSGRLPAGQLLFQCPQGLPGGALRIARGGDLALGAEAGPGQVALLGLDPGPGLLVLPALVAQPGLEGLPPALAQAGLLLGPAGLALQLGQARLQLGDQVGDAGGVGAPRPGGPRPRPA